MTHSLSVLIVDDSSTARSFLGHIINSAPDMRVVGEATGGHQAVQLTHDLHPDVIVMDLVMPNMDGLVTTREIMHATPTPIVLVSASLDTYETDIAFQAMNAGALGVHKKPPGIHHLDHVAEADQLLSKLRLMAGVRVIHHWKPRPPATPAAPNSQWATIKTTTVPEIIAVVASTGGPTALHTIIQQLPSDFTVPIVIVQHISPDFIESLVNWLAQSSPLPVELAQDGQRPVPGTIYLAPANAHLHLTRGHRFELVPASGMAHHVPSGNILLEGVAHSYGERSVGIVLTGIGDDGAHGLRAMRDAGAFTIAQDEATSVVYGMPKVAHDLHAARQVLPLSNIAPVLVRLTDHEEITL